MLKKIILISLVLVACTKEGKKESSDMSQMNGMDEEMQATNYKGPNILEVVPGKSLGDVHIGDKMMALMKIGFDHDKSYSDPENHMQRGDVMLYLVDDQVAQISYKGNGDYNKLKLSEKDFPKSKVPMQMKSFFKNCEPTIQNSTGSIIYCENRGIRIDYDNRGSFVGFSVVTVANHEPVAKPTPEKLKTKAK